MTTSLCCYKVTVFAPKLGRPLTGYRTTQIPRDAIKSVEAAIRKEFKDPDMELLDPKAENVGFVGERHKQLRLHLPKAS